jgi:hypothetical protein
VKVVCFRDLSGKTESDGIVFYSVVCLSKKTGPFLQKHVSALAS